MRQADINRVMKAKEKLQAAFGKLCDIKWENISGNEDYGVRCNALVGKSD